MKKAFKIIVAVIVVVAVIIGGIFAYKFISTNMKIENTEKKLSQINAKELESKIINELENTSLNVNTSTINTTFATCDKNGGAGTDFAISIAYSMLDYPREDFYEGYVCAYYGNNNNSNTFIIPCFRIESDSNGKVQNIEYAVYDNFDISSIIEDTITNILQTQYDTENIYRISELKDGYGTEWQSKHLKQKLKMFYSNNDYVADIITKIKSDKNKSNVIADLEKGNIYLNMFVWNIE